MRRSVVARRRLQTRGLVLIAAVVVSAMTGCSRSSERRENVLRIAIEARPGTFDPRHSIDAASGRISELVFSRLVKYDPNLRIVPDLAERWDIEEGGRLYRFHLRDGVRFHDGSILDAEDVAFTFRSILDPATASPKRQTYQFIDHIDVIDPRTIEFHLREPNAPFLTNMILGILPSEVANNPSLAAPIPVGSGPFRMVQNENGTLIRLEAFSDSFDGRPPLDAIVFRYIFDGPMRVLELGKGSVDFLQNDITPEFIPALRKDEHLKVISAPGVNCSYIGMNLKTAALSKPLVREAVARAIDRDSIQAFILRDTATLADAILGPTVLGSDPALRAVEYDPAKSRSLLDQAGYPDPDGPGPLPRFSLRYKTSTDKMRLRIAEVFRRNLEEIGIRVQIQSLELGTLMSDIKTGNFDLYSLTWVGLAEPDGLFNIFHSSAVPPNGANRVYYSNPLVDRLLESGRVELDEAQRASMYRQVHNVLAKELPLFPLWFTNNIAVMRRDVQGFQLYPLGSYYSLAHVWLDEFPPRDSTAAAGAATSSR